MSRAPKPFVQFETLPYPIARLYADVLEEQDPRLQFRAAIKVFAGTIKYISLLCIADYLQNPDSDRINSKLSSCLARPSGGHWIEFIREIGNHYRRTKRRLPLRELARALSGRFGPIVEHLNFLRNNYVHPDVFPSPSLSSELTAEVMPLVDSLLDRLAFLSAYPLIRTTGEDAAEEALMGTGLTFASSAAYRCLVRVSENATLDITPFLLIAVDTEFQGLLVYEALVGDRAKFTLGNALRWVHVGDEPDNRVALLRALLDRCASEETRKVDAAENDARLTLGRDLARNTIALSLLRGFANRHSEAMLGSYTDARRYDTRTYVARLQLRAAYDELLDGSRNALVIVGDSGLGKSTEIIQLYIERLESDFAWIINGRNVTAASPLSPLTTELFDDPEQAHEALGALFQAIDASRASERFVVLFDGLNETDDPERAFRNLHRFISNHSYPWLKIVITCRSFVWHAIEHAAIGLARENYVISATGALAHTLLPFDDDELQTALRLYASVFECSFPAGWIQPGKHDIRDRRLLRSPLLLRFLCEAYRGREVASALDIGAIMKAFTKERLRERDLPFLQQHLMSYCYQEEADAVDLSTLFDRSEELPAEARAAYVALAEHISSEQVSALDAVALCPNSRCRYSALPPPLEEERAPIRCPECSAILVTQNLDNRSTYARLLAENIVTEEEVAGRPVVRLVFDRYFEYLMAEFCLRRMGGRYDSQQMATLLQKVQRSAVFAGVATQVAMQLWRSGDPRAVYDLATDTWVGGVYLLRQVCEQFVATDFDLFAAAWGEAVEDTGFNANLCRTGIGAVLSDPSIAEAHSDVIASLLLVAAPCRSDTLFEDVADDLVELRSRGVDLISSVAQRCGMLIGSMLTAGGLTRMAISSRARAECRGLVNLYSNIALFGLGNFFHDDDIRNAIGKSGLSLIRQLLRNPIVSVTHGGLVRLWLSRRIARIYKTKGPLPCNYWEMLFQLTEDRDAIRQAGQLFFVERGNVFELPFEQFTSRLHSENGLLSWFSLSALPAHYRACSDKATAVGYLQRLCIEGTEMDRYVVGQCASILIQDKTNQDPDIENVLESIGAHLVANPHEMFLHPEPTPMSRAALAAVDYTNSQTALIQAESNPHAIPWMLASDGKLYRFYINTVAYHYALSSIRRERPAKLELILKLLQRNRDEDLLRFAVDPIAAKCFVSSYLIQSLERAAASGFLNEVLATLDVIVERFIVKEKVAALRSACEFGVVEALTEIRRAHPNAVVGFLEHQRAKHPEVQFLPRGVGEMSVRRRLFNFSAYGHNVYESCFSIPAVRRVFGELTINAADEPSVEGFLGVYARGLLRFFGEYPDTTESPQSRKSSCD